MSSTISKEFNPNLSNPYYFIRKLLYKKIEAYSPLLSGRLLDFGCGSKPYKSLFTNVSSYTGIDYENSEHLHKQSQVDVFYDGKSIPFGNNEFDAILCSEVFEHVFNLEEIIPELNRVLKPGGKILITCPFVWYEHEVPYDYARYTIFALQHLLEKNGFEINVLDKTGDYATTLHQMKMVYFSEHFLQSIYLIGKIKFITSNIRPPLMLLFNTVFLIKRLFLPKRYSLYLNNVVVATKK